MEIGRHYDINCQRMKGENRRASSTYGLRKMNNWIKSVLIQDHVHEGDQVLDLACGRGGDVNKFKNARIKKYVGVDISSDSIDEARGRAPMASGKFSFHVGDAFGPGLLTQLAADAKKRNIECSFRVCVCNFALHYSWSSEERARQALKNVASVLSPGGYFIGTVPDSREIFRRINHIRSTSSQGDGDSGSAGAGKAAVKISNALYSITFDEKPTTKDSFGVQYHFKLIDAVDCPEWLVFFPKLTDMAREYGLELVLHENFASFVRRFSTIPRFRDLMEPLGVKDMITTGWPREQSDISSLYCAFAFRKQIELPQRSRKRARDYDI